MVSDGEAQVLEFWLMWSTPLLPLLSDPLWYGAVVPVRIQSIGQIEIFNPFLKWKISFHYVQTHDRQIQFISIT